jgi:hypothetical protein
MEMNYRLGTRNKKDTSARIEGHDMSKIPRDGVSGLYLPFKDPMIQGKKKWKHSLCHQLARETA